MESKAQEIRKKLKTLQQIVAEGIISDKSLIIHREAKHRDHQRCVIIGLNATPADMCVTGHNGSYFTIDENGRLYEQYFTQGTENHHYDRCNIISEDDFISRIAAFPEDNMASKDYVLSWIEDNLGGKNNA